MSIKNEIIKKLEEKKDFLRKKDVKKIGLFGSFLKGKSKRGSDIDLIVEFNKIDSNNYFELWFYLQNLFKKKVDLVIESSLRKELNYVKREAEYVKL